MITTVDELAGSLYNVVPTAAALGVEFDQVSASMATMTSMGTPTSVATTQLRSAMNELSKSGTKASDTFKELSGQTFQEFIAGGGNLSDAMIIMEKGAKELNLNVTDLFSSVEAGAVALALTGTGAEKFNESLALMQDSAGATQTAYETMAQGFNASFEKMVNAGKNVLVMLGEKLAPVMIEISEWVMAHMPQIQAIVEATFNIIGKVIDVAINVIKTLISAFKDLFKSNTELSSNLSKTWESIKGMFQATFKELGELINAFIGLCTRIWDKYGEDIKALTESLWNGVKTIFEAATTILKDIIDIFTAVFKGDWEELSKVVQKLCQDMWEGVKKLFSTAIDWIFTLVPKMFRAGSDIFNGLWNGLKSVWTGISSWISDKVNWLVDKLAFWRKGQNEMSSNSRAGSRSLQGEEADGSHRNGLYRVPFDGYRAILHEGERVLTKGEAQSYRRQKEQPTFKVEGSMIEVVVNGKADDDIVQQLRNEAERISEMTIRKINKSMSTKGYKSNAVRFGV